MLPSLGFNARVAMLGIEPGQTHGENVAASANLPRRQSTVVVQLLQHVEEALRHVGIDVEGGQLSQ